MKIRNLKVGKQFMIGFAVMMLFVLVLGLTAYIKTDQLHHQTEKIYQHTLIVRRALPRLQHIPIIALTASAMTHERETNLSHGFDAFIPKPIIEKQFFEMISVVQYGK